VGKTRLLEATRDAALGFKKIHNTCEAYTSSTPYAVWRDLLREMLEIPRDAPDGDVEARLRAVVAEKAPDVEPWLPLIATAYGIRIDSTPEVDMLAEENRRAKLHEAVERFVGAMMPGPAFVEIENAHHMDEASAELLKYLVGTLPTHRWLFGVARRPGPAGFVAPESASVTRIELKPIAIPDALRMAELATKESPLPAHVLEVVAQRSGGNPQFLRDLLRFAIQSGGIVGLPDSAEAAADRPHHRTTRASGGGRRARRPRHVEPRRGLRGRARRCARAPRPRPNRAAPRCHPTGSRTARGRAGTAGCRRSAAPRLRARAREAGSPSSPAPPSATHRES
jgi:hypothetical protein